MQSREPVRAAVASDTDAITHTTMQTPTYVGSGFSRIEYVGHGFSRILFSRIVFSRLR